MKRTLTVTFGFIALFLCLASNTLAIDGYFAGDNIIYPTWNSSVKLLKAGIEIEAGDGEWKVDSRAYYYNYGKTRTFLFGFPRPGSGKEGKLLEFKTYVAKRLRKKSLKRSKSNSKIKGLSYDKVYTAWVKIGSGKKSYLKHTYIEKMNKDSLGHNTLSYILKPAKLWKSKVDRILVKVKNIDTDFICRVKPSGYVIDNENKNITWKISKTNPNEDINIIWQYGLRDWVDKSSGLIKGACSESLLEEIIGEGKALINQCFLEKDIKKIYPILRKNENAKKLVTDVFKSLVSKHPSAGDLSKVFYHNKYIYKFSSDKDSLAKMYSEFLEKVKRRKFLAAVEQLEEIAGDSNDYLENKEIALLSYKLIFKFHKDSIKEEKKASLICGFAKSYIDNKLYDKAIKTYGTINKISENKKDVKTVLDELVKLAKNKVVKLDIKTSRMANKMIIRVCRPHLKKSEELRKYEFGALLRTAVSYRKEGNYKKAVSLYEGINRNKSYSSKLKDRYVTKQLKTSREKAKNQTDSLPLRIVKIVFFVILLFILITLSDKIKSIYGFIGSILKKIDNILYFIWSKLRPVLRVIFKPLVFLVNKPREGIVEIIEDRLPVSITKFFSKIFSFIGSIIGGFINNFRVAFRDINRVLAGFINRIPGRTRGKLRNLAPVPDRAYFTHVFSSFKSKKEKIIRESGEIKKDRKWKGEVIVTGDIFIKKGATLIIRPDTKVSFNANASDNDIELKQAGRDLTNKGKCDIIVQGKLLAEGREGAPVIFGEEGWGSIVFTGDVKGSIMKLCEVSGAVNAIVCCDSASPAISECRLSGNSGFAITCAGNSSPLIVNNEITGNASGGILCGNNSSSKINNNKFGSNNAVGIRCEDSANPKVFSNKLSGDTLIAIECRNSSSPKLSKNIIQECREFGIACKDSSSPSIKENNIANNGIGVACVNSSKPAINTNRIRGSRIGIDCSDSSTPVMKGNILTSNNNGIDLKTVSGLKIASNSLNSSIDAGIACRGTTKYVIKENTFEKNSSGITCYDENPSELTANKFKENKAGLTCEDSSKPVFDGNTLEDNYYGIICLNKSSPTLSNNNIKKSKNAGLKCLGNSTPEFTCNTLEKNEIGFAISNLSGANIDGSNVLKDNKTKEEPITEEGTPVARRAPSATAAEGSEAPGQPQFEDIAGDAPAIDPVGEMKSIYSITMNEETVEGRARIIINALEEAIGFDLVEETFSDESLPNLEKIGEAIKTFTDYKIEINVHTDNAGNPAYNLELSKNIGRTIKEWLINIKKINGDNIKSEGYGGQKPVASNDSGDGRHKNRRVEFILTGA